MAKIKNKNLFIVGGGSAKVYATAVSLSKNGIYTFKPEGDADGFSEFEVNVNVEGNILGSQSFDENGTFKATDFGVDGFSEVEINVQGKLQEKSVEITENTTTTITADEGFDGLSKVDITTNVAGSGGGSSDEIISALLQQGGIIGEFVIPDTVKEVKIYGLAYQTRMNKLRLPNSVTTLGNYALTQTTGLNEFIYDANLSQTAISNSYPFYRAGADYSKFIVGENASVIPNSLLGTTSETYMPKFAYFYNEPRIKNLDIGNLQTSSTNASNSNMKKIWLDDFGGANLSLGQNTFRNFNSLTTIYFNAKNITNSHSSGSPFNAGGNNAVVKFGEDVQSIGDRILNGSTIKNVYVGSNVKSIGTKGLYVTSVNLKSITINCETPPTIQSDTFGTAGTIYIPKGTLNKYSSATNWSALTSRFVELEQSNYTDGNNTLRLDNNSWYEIDLTTSSGGKITGIGTYTLNNGALSLVVFDQASGTTTISGTLTDNVITIVRGLDTFTLNLEA